MQCKTIVCSKARNGRRGFTLVELLVVIAIIGILVSLLLPAVQSAREAGRRTVCSNNVKQISLAFNSHAATFGHFPTCGWGYAWIGDPDRGFGLKQPGGWIYNILPYVEQDAIRNIARDTTDSSNPAKHTLLAQVKSIPVATFLCPSRRAVKAYPASEGSVNSDPASLHNKTDYGGNAGDNVQVFYGPGSLAEGDNPGYAWPTALTSETGITYLRSTIPPADVRDGLSHTYLAGEKYLNPDSYETGTDGADNNSMFQGHDWDILRWASSSFPPMQDTPGYLGWERFGSAHSGAAFFAFADGSVHSISYSIDPELYRRLGNRKDGQVVDESKY